MTGPSLPSTAEVELGPPVPNLASFVFTMTAEEDTTLPQYPGRVLHGALLRWLERDHPRLVTMLHEKNYARPYTLSQLRGRFERSEGMISITSGTRVWYRLTGIGSQFIACVQGSIRQSECGPQLDDASLAPGPIYERPNDHPAARSTQFGWLLSRVYRALHAGILPSFVVLRFESPACFIENKQSLPLPLPRLVFGYLAKKWQLVSPIPLPVAGIEELLNAIYLTRMEIKSRVVDLQKFHRTGFVGTVGFGIAPHASDDFLTTLHVLARFAFYCGVGSHTTMGMGQARQLPTVVRTVKPAE